MKREILFRGKRLDNGKWFNGNLITSSNGYAFIDTNNELYEDEPYLFRDNTDMIRVAVSKVDEGTVGQFTGLHDKNGKEIYEGDIMPVYENGEEYTYKVLYDGDCFMLGFIDSEQGSYPLSTKCNISEVIGNIHDNPELLKTENNETI